MLLLYSLCESIIIFGAKIQLISERSKLLKEKDGRRKRENDVRCKKEEGRDLNEV